MKSLLLILAGAVVGFSSAILFRISPPAANAPAPKERAIAAGVRTARVPPDFIKAVAEKLSAARLAGASLATTRELQSDIDRWMRADPVDCIAWLAKHGALGLVRHEQLGDVFVAAFGGNLALAIREALLLPDPLLRYEWLNAAFEVATDRSPAEAFQLLHYLPAANRESMGEKIITRLAQLDPAAAWENIVASPKSWSKDSAERWQSPETWAKPILQVWAQKDPAGFAAFLRARLAQATLGRESTILADALEQLAYTSASGLLLDVLGRSERNLVTEHLWENALHLVARTDHARASRAVLSVPEGLARADAITIAARGTSVNNPARALEMLESLPVSETRHAATTSALESQAERDPAAAAANARAVENLLARAEAMKGVADTWLQKDPAALARFALESAALESAALDSAAPDAGPAWLDIVAQMLRTGATYHQNQPWLLHVDLPTRQRLAPAMRERLTSREWERIAGYFEPAHR